jgi:hypothetical protein
MEAIDVSVETVSRLWRALEEISNLARTALGKDAGPEWTCHECGNIFSRVDGTRTCTRSKRHYCPLPDDIRRQRDRRGLQLKGVDE